jgi:purine-nucleoside phosphorylase
MNSRFSEFAHRVHSCKPYTAVVLGSGLAEVAQPLRELTSLEFGDLPGLVPPTVHGHRGRLTLGHWHEAPVLIFFGRLHYYEGHHPAVVTGPVHLAARLGIRRMILTNAAGGLHPNLEPGSLLALRGHVKLIGPQAWRQLANGTAVANPYSPQLLNRLPELQQGLYAALTGPCYETPAEIRALATCGVDAVGMSTALEAEAAAELGLEVAGLSCITNKAAGLTSRPLDHAEVLTNARLVVQRLAHVLDRLILPAPPTDLPVLP